jgi:glycosyltransferase involved in cell wall biosynthesis
MNAPTAAKERSSKGTVLHVIMLLFYPRCNERQRLMLQSYLENGWKVSVVAWDRNGTSRVPQEFQNSDLTWHDIRIPAPLGKISILKQLPAYYWRVSKFLKEKKNRHSLLVLTHILLLPFGLLSKAKKIYDACEMYVLDAPRYFGAFDRHMRFLITRYENLFIKFIDGITTVDSKGDWLKRYYEKMAEPIKVIWNVPSRTDKPDHSEIKKLEEIYSNKKIVAFVGGLRKEKGLITAIDAAAIVKRNYENILFLFIGSMRADQKSIKALIARYELEDNIQFLKTMSYRKMLAHMHYADIGLALQRKERIYTVVSMGNGRKIFTYMQSGLAIVAPDFGEIGLPVKKANCGMLVDSESSSAVAEAIVDLFSKPEEMKRMQSSGKEAFNNHFCWELEKIKYQNFLDSILGTF